MDYSPFYFKNFYEKKGKGGKKRRDYRAPYGEGYGAPGEEPGGSAPEYEYETAARDAGAVGAEAGRGAARETGGTNPYRGCETPAKRKGDRTGLFAAAIIILCFAVLVFAAEFMSGGAVVSGLKAAFNPNEGVKYYFLTTEGYDSEANAVKHAEVIRKRGGAGYIHVSEGQYYVVIATYLDKKSAKSVQSKNEDTVIFELETRPVTLSSSATEHKALANKTRDKVIDAVRELYAAANDLDSGAAKHQEIMERLSVLRNDFLNLKDEVASSSMTAADKNRLFRIIDPVYGGLDALFYESTGDFLSAAIRNITAGAVTALCY